MQVATVQAASEDVRTFIQEHFDAWKGTDEQTILTYYSDDVVISLPTGALEGKTAVRDNFVRPSRQGELDANRLSAAVQDITVPVTVIFPLLADWNQLAWISPHHPFRCTSEGSLDK
jgi:ketosteroid isomerase-like protein